MWALESSVEGIEFTLVANTAFARPHMLQVSCRDESFLILSSVMKLRHSRKRDKIYLKKLYFLRNFLNLLQFYRSYLSWKFRKRPKAAVEWHQRRAIEWKTVRFKLTWNSVFNQQKMYTTVIFRYYQCQLTITFLINSPRLFSFIAPIDKTFHIFSGRKTVRRNLLIACEFVDEIVWDDLDRNVLGIHAVFLLCAGLTSLFYIFRANTHELDGAITPNYRRLSRVIVERERLERADTSILHQPVERRCDTTT